MGNLYVAKKNDHASGQMKQNLRLKIQWGKKATYRNRNIKYLYKYKSQDVHNILGKWKSRKKNEKKTLKEEIIGK